MLLIDGLDADDAPKQVHPAKAKVLASKRGVKWEKLDLSGQAEIVSEQRRVTIPNARRVSMLHNYGPPRPSPFAGTSVVLGR